MQPAAGRQQSAGWAGAPSTLQQLLVLLARRAALRIAPGDVVIAAELLRAVGRLDVYVQQYQQYHQQQGRHTQQQQQQHGQLGLARRRRQLQEH
ncbi:hypothetical protein OEZ85_002679 [Tetradesmus obliquus]|uniref:Uncharacterized protein n=1 Tax=Tetradesmus obliquus TaxID=3088 RepID=A0ABY8U0Y9_TETOB|nr:hypothetical protein OEZ85_002679 [Tetradesmus obliquus]